MNTLFWQVLGGLSADYDSINFLRFRSRVGWNADGIEMLMRVQVTGRNGSGSLY